MRNWIYIIEFERRLYLTNICFASVGHLFTNNYYPNTLGQYYLGTTIKYTY